MLLSSFHFLFVSLHALRYRNGIQLCRLSVYKVIGCGQLDRKILCVSIRDFGQSTLGRIVSVTD